jgi:hypothetical protein
VEAAAGYLFAFLNLLDLEGQELILAVSMAQLAFLSRPKRENPPIFGQQHCVVRPTGSLFPTVQHNRAMMT